MNNLEPAMQHYPILYIMQERARPAALLTSASGQTTTGVFPPNSRQIFFKFEFAEASIIFLPTKVDPVKLIFAILRDLLNASPASGP